MLTPEEAWKSLESSLEPLSPERVPRRKASGRVLAAPLLATADLPPADVSAMDGYALAGPAAAGETLPVVATAAAGRPLSETIPAASAAKIMTGAVVPPGADRVIPVEQTDGGKERVTLTAAPAAGAHVRRQGEVVRRGQTLLERGALLTPGALSLAAAHGHGELEVVGAPTVAVLTTGDELVPPEAEPEAGQLRDSNTAFLLAAGLGLGFGFRSLGIAPDRRRELRALLEAGLEADVLLVCGGVSMGEYDFVEDVLDELGCEALFDRVAVQPGKPLVAARHRRGWVFGLPGNPASVMVTFWLFVRPLLRRLAGHADRFWRGSLEAELAAPLAGSKGRDRFLPASVAFAGGRPLATPHPPQGSHDVVAYARGTALVRVRPHRPPAAAGETCEILPLIDWPPESAAPPRSAPSR